MRHTSLHKKNENSGLSLRCSKTALPKADERLVVICQLVLLKRRTKKGSLDARGEEDCFEAISAVIILPSA